MSLTLTSSPIGPLTTTFTPDATCYPSQSQIYVSDHVLHLWGNPLRATQSPCLPYSAKYVTQLYFSPGLICPVGFTIACSSSSVSGQDTETIATCCPSAANWSFACKTGFHIAEYDDLFGCIANLTSDLVTTANYIYPTVIAPTILTLIDNLTSSAHYNIDAVSVQLRWKNNDLPASTVGSNRVPAIGRITTPISFPVTPYTGQPLLTGTCTELDYTALYNGNNKVQILPLIGCQNAKPGCCPSISKTPSASTATITGNVPIYPNNDAQRALNDNPVTKCPSDYIETGSLCCPFGFSIYNQAFLGNTPCYIDTTSLPTPASVTALANSIQSALGSAATASSTITVSIDIIVNQVFALSLPHKDASPGLSTGAKAGIGVGVSLGSLLFVAGFFMLFSRRRRQREAEKQNVPTQAPETMSQQHTANRESVISGGYKESVTSGTTFSQGQGYISPPESMGGHQISPPVQYQQPPTQYQQQSTQYQQPGTYGYNPQVTPVNQTGIQHQYPYPQPNGADGYNPGQQGHISPIVHELVAAGTPQPQHTIPRRSLPPAQEPQELSGNPQ